MNETAMKVDPALDGVDHINIRYDAVTELGRLLDNMAHTPFKHDKYGKFESVEGFYWWLVAGRKLDALRKLYGPDVRKYAKLFGNNFEHQTGMFINQVSGAVMSKIMQNQNLHDKFIESTLPFKCYSVYGKSKAKIVEGKGHNNQVDFLERLREALKVTA